MTFPLIPIALGLGTTGGIGSVVLGTLFGKTQTKPDAIDEATAARIAMQDPSTGTWALRPDVAMGVYTSLGNHTYRVVEDKPLTAHVTPTPDGAPPAPQAAASSWAKGYNDRYAILVSWSLAVTMGKKRFLAAVPVSEVAAMTGPSKGYVLLALPGVLSKIPSSVIVPPSPSSDQLAALQAKYEQVLRTATDPDALDQAANAVEAAGLRDLAARLRARAAELRAKRGGIIIPDDNISPLPRPPQPNVLPPSPPPAPVPSQASFAKVVTSSPPPDGDLKIRSAPSTSAQQIGGAEKDGVVSILQWNAKTADGHTWARIRWGGGSRWPAVEGYASQSFLRPTSEVPVPPSPLPGPSPTPTPTVQKARVVTKDPPPAGDIRIRSAPSTGAPQIGGAAKDSLVDVLEWNAATANGYTWAKIRSYVGGAGGPAATGYAAQNFLQLVSTTTSGYQPTAPVFVTKAPTGLFKSHGFDAAKFPTWGRLAVIPAGVAVKVLRPLPQGWLHVEYQGRKGFISPPPPDPTVARTTPYPTPLFPSLPTTTHFPSQADMEEKMGVLFTEPSAVVRILVWNAGGPAGTFPYARVQYRNRVGFINQAFLTPLSGTTTSGLGTPVVAGRGRLATVNLRQGLCLRRDPKQDSTVLTCAPFGAVVSLGSLHPGSKTHPGSPGPGGWARVEYKGQRGWVPAEWLTIQTTSTGAARPNPPGKQRRPGTPPGQQRRRPPGTPPGQRRRPPPATARPPVPPGAPPSLPPGTPPSTRPPVPPGARPPVPPGQRRSPPPGASGRPPMPPGARPPVPPGHRPPVPPGQRRK